MLETTTPAAFRFIRVVQICNSIWIFAIGCDCETFCNQDIEMFQVWKCSHVSFLKLTFCFYLWSQAIIDLLSTHILYLVFLELQTNRITQYIVFVFWLPLLTIVLRFTHIVATIIYLPHLTTK
jgi:hypothetical protein